MSNTQNLRARIASELNRSLTDSFGNSGETFATAVNREINSAIRHYESGAFRWNQRRRQVIATTAAGVTDYSLPASFLAMRRLECIYQGNYYAIEKGAPEDIDKLNYRQSMTSAAVSIPQRHAVDGNILVLAPPANAAITLVASYTYRNLPTSLSGSYTAVIPTAGGNMSVTSSLSHENQVNGWTTDASDLIAERAKAALKIRYIKNQEAIAEAGQMSLARKPFLSAAEENAYQALADEANDLVTLGKVRPYCI